MLDSRARGAPRLWVLLRENDFALQSSSARLALMQPPLHGLLVLPVLATQVCAQAPSPNPGARGGEELERRIDGYLSAHVEASDFSGTVLLAKDGDPIFLESYGLANREWGIPNAADTKFRIGSITKPFTAVLVLQLREEGLLGLEDSICEYIERCPDNWATVTLRHLLTHTSGLPSHDRHPEWQAHRMVPHTAEQILDYGRGAPLAFEHGEGFRYNNFGYYLLGLVIERVTGQKYEEALKQRVLTPSGMADTGVDWSHTIIPRRAAGYDGRGSALRNTPPLHMQGFLGSGSLYSTALDLLEWDQALYGDRLLSGESKASMWEPVREGHAAGWEVTGPSTQTFGHVRHAHSGGINGFGACLVRVPEPRLTAVVLANNESTPATDMANAILAIYYGQEVEMPAARTVAAVDPATYEAYVGGYRLPSGAVMTIARDGERLFAEVVGPGRFELLPESEARFFSDTPEVTIEFTVRDGLATQLVLNYAGRDRAAQRVE